MIQYFLWWKLQHILHLSIHTCVLVFDIQYLYPEQTRGSLFIQFWNLFCMTFVAQYWWSMKLPSVTTRRPQQQGSKAWLQNSYYLHSTSVYFQRGSVSQKAAVTNRKIVQKTMKQISKELNCCGSKTNWHREEEEHALKAKWRAMIMRHRRS